MNSPRGYSVAEVAEDELATARTRRWCLVESLVLVKTPLRVALLPTEAAEACGARRVVARRRGRLETGARSGYGGDNGVWRRRFVRQRGLVAGLGKGDAGPRGQPLIGRGALGTARTPRRRWRRRWDVVRVRGGCGLGRWPAGLGLSGGVEKRVRERDGPQVVWDLVWAGFSFLFFYLISILFPILLPSEL